MNLGRVLSIGSEVCTSQRLFSSQLKKKKKRRTPPPSAFASLSNPHRETETLTGKDFTIDQVTKNKNDGVKNVENIHTFFFVVSRVTIEQSSR